MERILLYYPSTNIPDGSWVRNCLLYNDKVASILPYEMDHQHVTDLTKILSAEGVFQPIYISNVLLDNGLEYQTFENNFKQVIESVAFQNKRTTDKEFHSEGTREYEMFKNKLTGNLIEYLSEKQLLEDRDWGEIAVERNTAAVYLGMLSDYLARIDKDNVVIPSSDQQEFEDIVFRLADEKVETVKIQLSNCLPVPRQDTSIKEIIEFKNKRADELGRFRKVLREIEQKLSSARTSSEQKEIMYDFQEEIKSEIHHLKKLLADAKLEHGFSSFSSLLEFSNKELLPAAGSIAAASGGIVFNHPITGVVTGAIVLAGTLINSHRKIKRSVDANSFSYLYQAKKAGLFND